MAAPLNITGNPSVLAQLADHMASQPHTGNPAQLAGSARDDRPLTPEEMAKEPTSEIMDAIRELRDEPYTNSGAFNLIPFQGIVRSSMGMMLRNLAYVRRGEGSIYGNTPNGGRLLLMISNQDYRWQAPFDLRMMVDGVQGIVIGAGLDKHTVDEEERRTMIPQFSYENTATHARRIQKGRGEEFSPFSWISTLKILFGMTWRDNHYPSVKLTEEDASLFISTKTGANLLNEMIAPFDSFLITLPPGLVRIGRSVVELVDDEQFDITHIAVMKSEIPKDLVITAETKDLHDINISLLSEYVKRAKIDIKPDQRRWWYLAFSARGNLLYIGTALNDEELCATEELSEEDTIAQRNLLAIGRIIQGVCCEMNNKDRVREIPEKKRPKGVNAITWAKKHKRVGLEYELLPTIKRYPEVVAAARDYCAGTRDSASVFTKVCRHRKRQPCGKLRQERKWITIEPYTRGDASAPLAVKSHTL